MLIATILVDERYDGGFGINVEVSAISLFPRKPEQPPIL